MTRAFFTGIANLVRGQALDGLTAPPSERNESELVRTMRPVSEAVAAWKTQSRRTLVPFIEAALRDPEVMHMHCENLDASPLRSRRCDLPDSVIASYAADGLSSLHPQQLLALALSESNLQRLARHLSSSGLHDDELDGLRWQKLSVIRPTEQDYPKPEEPFQQPQSGPSPWPNRALGKFVSEFEASRAASPYGNNGLSYVHMKFPEKELPLEVTRLLFERVPPEKLAAHGIDEGKLQKIAFRALVMLMCSEQGRTDQHGVFFRSFASNMLKHAMQQASEVKPVVQNR